MKKKRNKTKTTELKLGAQLLVSSTERKDSAVDQEEGPYWKKQVTVWHA